MAHNIEGNYYFGVNKPAWHGIGIPLQDAPTPREAWERAYPHHLFKMGVAWKDTDIETGAPVYGDAEGFSAIVRDDGKVLGVHSNRYELVQPADVFDRYAPLIESGLVTLETGGSLNGGKRMWALAKVTGADADVLPGDTIRGYVLFQESFDGSLCSGGGFTNIRVVCANTLAMAQSDVTLRCKHTRGVHDRLNAYRDEIKKALQSFQETKEIMQSLARKQVTRHAQEVYIREVIAGPNALSPDSELSARTENKVERVIELLDTQRGLELVPAMRGTAWQAYNAITEYITHEHGRSADTRLGNQWFGPGVQVNRNALELATRL